MAQETLVLMVQGPAGEALRQRLAAGPFELRSAPHALFSARGQGVTATLYRSGKLVVQGADPTGFAEAWVGEVPAVRSKSAADDDLPTLGPGPTIGSDESGKGDWFGPLVVAAVRVTLEQAEGLAQGEVKDSKRVADSSALRLGGALRAHLPHAVVRLDPPEYAKRLARARNLNALLAEQHAEAIGALAVPGALIVVDQFATPSVLERALGSVLEDPSVRLVQRPRAEALPVVAAASLIAREEFLRALAELSDEFGVELAKGAGEPADRAARELVRLHGREALGRAAKLHFANTARLGGPS